MMKSLKRISLLIAISFPTSFPLLAQDDIDQLLESSVDDAEKLIGGYIAPLMKSVSSGMNQGWYNTAKPHKIAGFDLTFTVNAMGIPKDELFYDVSKLGLERVQMTSDSPDYPNAPTIFGPEREPEYELLDEDGEPAGQPPFEGPPGIDPKGNFGVSRMPVPMAHLGFGLPKGFDLKLRFVPKIDLGDGGQLNMWGIGVMHDIKQWIPGLKLSPIDLSAFAGYTSFKMTAELDENTDDGRGVFQMSAFTVQGIVSKKISVLTLYGGAGFNIAKSKLAVQGTYEFEDEDGTGTVEITDPFNFNYSASGPRLTAGFRLKLAIFTLHTDYTLQKYSCLTVGFGFAVR